MQIQGLQQSSAIQALQSAGRARPAAGSEVASSAPGIAADQLDLSPEAQALSSTQSLSASSESNDIRLDRVTAIRQAIADGTYETPEKLSAALDRMLDSFA